MMFWFLFYLENTVIPFFFANWGNSRYVLCGRKSFTAVRNRPIPVCWMGFRIPFVISSGLCSISAFPPCLDGSLVRPQDLGFLPLPSGKKMAWGFTILTISGTIRPGMRLGEFEGRPWVAAPLLGEQKSQKKTKPGQVGTCFFAVQLEKKTSTNTS